MTVCIARLRTSVNRCEEHGAIVDGITGCQATTALSPAALRRARKRRIRSAADNAWPVGGRPRGVTVDVDFRDMLYRNV
jgi:hypothetical protein